MTTSLCATVLRCELVMLTILSLMAAYIFLLETPLSILLFTIRLALLQVYVSPYEVRSSEVTLIKTKPVSILGSALWKLSSYA